MSYKRFFSALFLLLFSGILFTNCENQASKPPFLFGLGTGINNATLMVNDIESAVDYYRDSLGFRIRRGAAKGTVEGTTSTTINFGNTTSIQLLSVDDTLKESAPEFIRSFLASNEGVRIFSLSSSSVDSTALGLTSNGFEMDSIQSYRSSSRMPEGWSRDDGSPQRRSLDFNSLAPPAHLPQFVERVGYDYKQANDEWVSYYVYGQMFNEHPNGAVGMTAIRVVVQDLNAATKEFKKMGFELIEQNETEASYRLYRNEELHLVAAGTDTELNEFLAQRGEGVFALRFEVSHLDSTHLYFQEELPSGALTKTADLLTVSAEHALGVQLEFEQEAAEQGLMVKKLMPREGLSEEAIVHGGELYTKYCALCHGENREGYAADNAPSLKSRSLLATSKGTNFMRYTMQYGRANTAMAGYSSRRGGPLEFVEIELLLQWLYEMAEVEEAETLSREPVLGDIALGASVYNANCAVCHGDNGEGVSAPALGNPMLLATATDHFLRYAIAEGRDGTPMIAFKDSLSNEQIDGLTAFLRSRASGWDIPEPDTVTVPTPDEYVLNPDSEAPVFDLRDEKFVSSEQVNKALEEGKRMIILDARSEVAWRQMHIPGSAPVPYYEDPENFIDDIPNDGTQIVIYCACPHAASLRVLNTLRRHGYKNTAIIDEGILVWAQMGFPVRNGS